MEWTGVAWLELLRVSERDQAGPAARTDGCRAEDRGLGSAGDAVVAAGPCQGQERHAAAGCAGVAGRRRWPAILRTLLVRCLRNAGRYRSLGRPPRRTSSAPLGFRARRANRVGDAIVVLVQSQPHR